MTEQMQLDWSTAEVSDGKLTVGLSAKPPKKWREAFGRTAALLSAGTWDVTLNSRNGSVQIASVQPGDEERVRQLVEGAALEANATLVSEQELFDSGSADDDDAHEPDADVQETSRDEELTGRFRAFGKADGDGDI